MLFFDIDHLINKVDRALRVVTNQATCSRANPALTVAEIPLNEREQKLSAGLMRVNHVGEICAQALYDAQGAFTSSPELQRQFSMSATEEEDHLAWTSQRLKELNSRPSLLNPLWYTGAYTLGSIAARFGDAASLGFVVETERQVEAHLANHLENLPSNDQRSRAIVDQMRMDEIDHGAKAQSMGASELPVPVKAAMKVMSKVMTSTAYYI